MKTVRKEWEAAKTPEERLAWADKWGDMLLETFQNPIWTEGYAYGENHICEQMEMVANGEYPDNMHPMVDLFAETLETVRKQITVVSFKVHGEKGMQMDLEEIKKQAAASIASVLANHINMDMEETDDETILHFNIVMIED